MARVNNFDSVSTIESNTQVQGSGFDGSIPLSTCDYGINVGPDNSAAVKYDPDIGAIYSINGRIRIARNCVCKSKEATSQERQV